MVVLRGPPVVTHGSGWTAGERLLQFLGINKPIPVKFTIDEHHGNMVGVGGAQFVIRVDVDGAPPHPSVLAGPRNHTRGFITQGAIDAGEEEDP